MEDAVGAPPPRVRTLCSCPAPRAPTRRRHRPLSRAPRGEDHRHRVHLGVHAGLPGADDPRVRGAPGSGRLPAHAGHHHPYGGGGRVRAGVHPARRHPQVPAAAVALSAWFVRHERRRAHPAIDVDVLSPRASTRCTWPPCAPARSSTDSCPQWRPSSRRVSRSGRCSTPRWSVWRCSSHGSDWTPTPRPSAARWAQACSSACSPSPSAQHAGRPAGPRSRRGCDRAPKHATSLSTSES